MSESSTAASVSISREELQLAARNRGMPLEALKLPITPSGLHYLLVHFDIPFLDSSTWQLRVGGNVHHPLQLSLSDLRELPATTMRVTLECAGNGRAFLEPRPRMQPWLNEAVSTAEWTGVLLKDVLDRAVLTAETVELVFSGADSGVAERIEHRYQRSLPLTEVLGGDVLLAYAMNGRALEPQHGFPLRLIVPGWYGMASVKWLDSIDAVSVPFEGYQQTRSYMIKTDESDPGIPVTRMKVRALMVPPGAPDGLARRRRVPAGQVVLEGRAWSGVAEVDRVQVSVDGTWFDAVLEPRRSASCWQHWTLQWAAEPGPHELACRATDAAGNAQPLDPEWNLQGMGNNAVQRIGVYVTDCSGV